MFAYEIITICQQAPTPLHTCLHTEQTLRAYLARPTACSQHMARTLLQQRAALTSMTAEPPCEAYNNPKQENGRACAFSAGALGVIVILFNCPAVVWRNGQQQEAAWPRETPLAAIANPALQLHLFVRVASGLHMARPHARPNGGVKRDRAPPWAIYTMSELPVNTRHNSVVHIVVL